MENGKQYVAYYGIDEFGGISCDFMQLNLEIPEEHEDDYLSFYPKEYLDHDEIVIFVTRAWPDADEVVELYSEEILDREVDEDDADEYGFEAREWFDNKKHGEYEERFVAEMKEEISEIAKKLGFDIEPEQIDWRVA